jgi:hypothetical protein
MTLRCKDGDLAVITWDHLGCLENIGRIVMVRGPAVAGEFGVSWIIHPITENLYAFIDLDHHVWRERVSWDSEILHPDAWMLPIRPPGDEQCMETPDLAEAARADNPGKEHSR